MTRELRTRYDIKQHGKADSVMRSRLSLVALCFTLLVPRLEAGAPDAKSAGPHSGGAKRGRMIGFIVGAGAGFGLGLLAGLNWFDDAVDSDRKVWTTAILLCAAGGTAGWFIGRAISPDLDVVPTAMRSDKTLSSAGFRFKRRPPAEPAGRPFRSLFSAPDPARNGSPR
jgi:hypothetical protein